MFRKPILLIVCISTGWCACGTKREIPVAIKTVPEIYPSDTVGFRTVNDTNLYIAFLSEFPDEEYDISVRNKIVAHSVWRKTSAGSDELIIPRPQDKDTIVIEGETVLFRFSYSPGYGRIYFSCGQDSAQAEFTHHYYDLE